MTADSTMVSFHGLRVPISLSLGAWGLGYWRSPLRIPIQLHAYGFPVVQRAVAASILCCASCKWEDYSKNSELRSTLNGDDCAGGAFSFIAFGHSAFSFFISFFDSSQCLPKAFQT